MGRRIHMNDKNKQNRLNPGPENGRSEETEQRTENWLWHHMRGVRDQIGRMSNHIQNESLPYVSGKIGGIYSVTRDQIGRMNTHIKNESLPYVAGKIGGIYSATRGQISRLLGERPSQKEREIHGGTIKDFVREARMEAKRVVASGERKPTTFLNEDPLGGYVEPKVPDSWWKKAWKNSADKIIYKPKGKGKLTEYVRLEESPHAIAQNARRARDTMVIQPASSRTTSQIEGSHEGRRVETRSTAPVLFPEAIKRIEQACSAKNISDSQMSALVRAGLVPDLREEDACMDRALFDRFAAEIPAPAGAVRKSFGRESTISLTQAAELLGVTVDDIQYARFSMDEDFIQAHLYYSTELLQSTIDAIQRVTPRQIAEAERLQRETDEREQEFGLTPSRPSADEDDNSTIMALVDGESADSDFIFPLEEDSDTDSGLINARPSDSDQNIARDSDSSMNAPHKRTTDKVSHLPQTTQEIIRLLYERAREHGEYYISAAETAELAGCSVSELKTRMTSDSHTIDSYHISNVIPLIWERAAAAIRIPDGTQNRIEFLRNLADSDVAESLAARLLGVSIRDFRLIAADASIESTLSLGAGEYDEPEYKTKDIIPLLEEKDKEFLLSPSDEMVADDDSVLGFASGSGLELDAPQDGGLHLELDDSAAFGSGVIEKPSSIANEAGPSPLRWKEEQEETLPESPEERIKQIYRWAREQDQWRISGARLAELVGVPEEELVMRILLHPDDSYTINDAVDLLRENAAERIPIPESPEDRIAYLRQKGKWVGESLAARLLGVSLTNFRHIAKAEGVKISDMIIMDDDEQDEDFCESDSIIRLIKKRAWHSQGETPVAVKKDEEFLLSPSDEMFNDAGSSAQLDSDMELDRDDDAIDPDLLEDDDEPLDLEDLSSTAGQASMIEATSRLSPNLSWAPRQSHQFIGLEEAAQIIGVTPDQLLEMRSNGDIRAFRDAASWRFKDDEVARVRDEKALSEEFPPSPSDEMFTDKKPELPDLGGDSIASLDLPKDEEKVHRDDRKPKRGEEFLLSPSDEMFADDSNTSSSPPNGNKLTNKEYEEWLSDSTATPLPPPVPTTLEPYPIRGSRFIDLNEASAILGITPDKLIEMRSNGEIRGFRDGARWRFKEEEVERVRGQRAGSASPLDLGGDSVTSFELPEDDDPF